MASEAQVLANPRTGGTPTGLERTIMRDKANWHGGK